MGQPSRFLLTFGNRGNVDAFGAPIALVVPTSFSIDLGFTIAPPPPQPGQVPTDWTTVPHAGGSKDVSSIFLVVPVIPAGFTGTLEFMMTAPPPATHLPYLIGAPMAPPCFEPTLGPSIVDQLAGGARDPSSRAWSSTGAMRSSPTWARSPRVPSRTCVLRGCTVLVSHITF